MSSNGTVRQHLIDPQSCIRCNTCEETCPVGAVTHDRHNYVVRADVCEWCQACIEPCPTGAIDNYRIVRADAVYRLDEQFAWDSLPDPLPLTSTAPVGAPHLTVPHLAIPHAPAPATAAQPVVQRYSAGHPLSVRLIARRRLNSASAASEILELTLAAPPGSLPLLEGQSVGVVPPGVDAEQRPHAMRLYSVTSPRDGALGEADHFTIAVKRVVVDHEDQATRGVCSNYLCDLEPGATLGVHGPFGQRFLMPDDADSRLLLIGSGTGLAPLWAMIERRLRHPQRYSSAPMLLLAGARSAGELPWFNELMRIPRERLHTHFAFSRVPGLPRHHVQDRLEELASDIHALLSDELTHIYICGRKGMEQGIHATLATLYARRGASWEGRLAQLAAAGRFHVETY